jgi:hypothetical protein
VSTLAFPQGKVPFSRRFANAHLHLFPTAHTVSRHNPSRTKIYFPEDRKAAKIGFGDIVLCGLIVAVVQATDPRVSNNATPSC